MNTHRDYFLLLAGVLLGILWLAGGTAAQVWEEWVATYNGPGNSLDEACALAVDANGDVYVAGYACTRYFPSRTDFLTIKYDSGGEREYVAYYPGYGYGGKAFDVAIDDAGNAYVTGCVSLGPDRGSVCCTIKYDSSGVEQWVAEYEGATGDGAIGDHIILDAEGNVYIAGRSIVPWRSCDYAVIKYNPAGIQDWSAVYNGPADFGDQVSDIAVDEDGNVYVTGGSDGINTHSDFATVKYNNLGAQQWVCRYDGPANSFDGGRSVAVDLQGYVYVTGFSYGIGTGKDYATIKYSPNGLVEWIERYDGPVNGTDEAHAIALDDSDNIFVTGYSWGIGTSLDFTTIKYNSSGAREWVSRYSGPGDNWDIAYALALDDEANVYVTGISYQQLGGYACVTIKYDSSGVRTAIATSYEYNNEIGIAIALDADRNVYVAGYCDSPYYGDDWLTIKHTQTCPINISVTPISLPIQIPPAGGSFDFNISLTNNASSAQTFDAWIMMQLPGGSWYGPVLGPVNITLLGGGNITRLRTQNIPARAPAGTYTYRGYVGDFPAKWDSSSFTFEKLGIGDSGLGIGNWDNSGQSFDENGEAFIIHNSSFIISCAPNPFNPVTTISFGLPEAGMMKLAVFDLLGRQVALLVNGYRPEGQHEITFDAGNLSSGIYVYRLETGDFSAAKKMILMK